MPKNIARRRLDYTPSPYLISKTHLSFKLNPNKTVVTATLSITRNQDCSLGNRSEMAMLVLDGENLELNSIAMNGRHLQSSQYLITDDSLSLYPTSDAFDLTIVTTIDPSSNSALEGLYFVEGSFCTQCEAEGFRKITYYLDRPDVLSVFTVELNIDEKQEFPYLLSNGNLVSDDTNDGQRTVVWHDPHPKPSYLFALVAGDFDKLTDEFITKDKRKVELQLFVEKGRKHQGRFALESLKKSMLWDEEKYGLAYDLDIYMVVAVDFFNMGAMENKGLNVFNSKFVLAEPKTATDEDYFNIESIIAHEYFHNWTGNRVTCRDWFQLSLKEGLTVFRDQQFSADMTSYLSTRIQQVKTIREHQFLEDAGPMSHPIRPDEVMEMNNFYTVTVYDKGAEVIRMMHTLLGEKGFRSGMDLYFERHDGSAVTCDDFVQAMSDATNTDLRLFSNWYKQNGTPTVQIVKKGRELHLQQKLSPLDKSGVSELFIPIQAEYITVENGQLTNRESKTIECDQPHVIETLSTETTIPILLDNFSAPVKVEYEYSLDELLLIIEHATSAYAKWDAFQTLFIKCVHLTYEQNNIAANGLVHLPHAVQEKVVQFAKLLPLLHVEDDVLSELLLFPSIDACLQYNKVNPLNMIRCREEVFKQWTCELLSFVETVLNNMSFSAYQYATDDVNKRKLQRNATMVYTNVSENSSSFDYLQRLYHDSDNMTQRLNALKIAQQNNLECFESLMHVFENEHKGDSVVMDKWFALHAGVEAEDIIERIQLLKNHESYNHKNPNKLRALIGTFGFYNPRGLHQESGSGYRFLADSILEIDKFNPQVASRLITPLLAFNDYEQQTCEKMKSQLSRIFNSKSISRDLFEKTSKALSS